MTKMPGGGRVMVEGVLLLDGTVLWLNGARKGCQGFGTASEPALDALIYSPKTKKWDIAGHTGIPRLYHSVALMLLDGTILVTGSNPNEMPLLDEDVVPIDPLRAYPTEFRIEKYTPSYLLNGNDKRRPARIQISPKFFIPGNTTITITFNTANKPKDVKVLLYHGGFVTHGLHMGQVMVELELESLKGLKNGKHEVRAKVPDIKLAPGPYVLYLVVDGVPGIGQFVSVG